MSESGLLLNKASVQGMVNSKAVRSNAERLLPQEQISKRDGGGSVHGVLGRALLYDDKGVENHESKVAQK